MQHVFQSMSQAQHGKYKTPEWKFRKVNPFRFARTWKIVWVLQGVKIARFAGLVDLEGEHSRHETVRSRVESRGELYPKLYSKKVKIKLKNQELNPLHWGKLPGWVDGYKFNILIQHFFRWWGQNIAPRSPQWVNYLMLANCQENIIEMPRLGGGEGGRDFHIFSPPISSFFSDKSCF